MLDKRGQEAAPFELLIAVIIMGFVIYIGMRAMSDLNCQKCYGETDAKLEEMKTGLENAAKKKGPQTINFYLSGCFDPDDEVVRVKEVNEPEVCASYCGAAKRLCILLQYFYSGGGCGGSFSIRKCLDINPDTVFPTGGRCGARAGMQLVDFRESGGIKQGYYLLIDKTSATDTFPTVCSYVREESASGQVN